jgi:hypothetical protein
MRLFMMPLVQEATVGLSAPLRCPLRRSSGAFGGTGNPRMRVLQNPTVAKKNLARLCPDSV